MTEYNPYAEITTPYSETIELSYISDNGATKENTELVVFDSIENPVKKYTSGFYKNVYFEDLSKKSALEIYGKSQFI